ncbi:MAG: response regulator [Ruthenibacterium sp.]
MYEIVVVEDKKITREGLVRLVDWQSLGAQVAAAFSGGNEAREYIAHHHVDVVITDIEMENGNGIDLLRYINNSRPQVKVIIISAYERFSYAHDALALGAFAYVLKPVEEKEILETTAKALKDIRTKQTDDLQSTLIVWERAAAGVSDWLTGGAGTIPTQALEALQSDFEVENASCFVFHAYGNVHLSIHRLREIAAETGQPVLLFPFQSNCCGFLSGALAASEQVLHILCTQWEIGEQVRFGVSGHGAPEEWPQMLRQANDAFAHNFWEEKQNAITWYETLAPREDDERESRIDSTALAKFLFADDYEAACKMIVETFAQWQREAPPLVHVLAQCEDVLARLQAELSPALATDFDRKLFEAQADGTQLKELFLRQMEALFDAVRSERSQTVRPITKLAFEYSVHHIEQPRLNLKMIAEELNVSYVYLSKAFKEDYRMGYTECMNQYRIDLAKHYLLDAQIRVYELCDKIGLEPKNFHYLFKKYVGMTPKEYQTRVVQYSQKEL